MASNYARYPEPIFADPRLGYIYALEWAGFLKIGRSQDYGRPFDIAKRLNRFQPKIPRPVSVVGIWQCWASDMASIERGLHEKYADRRAHGEWFEMLGLDLCELFECKDFNMWEFRYSLHWTNGEIEALIPCPS